MLCVVSPHIYFIASVVHLFRIPRNQPVDTNEPLQIICISRQLSVFAHIIHRSTLCFDNIVSNPSHISFLCQLSVPLPSLCSSFSTSLHSYCIAFRAQANIRPASCKLLLASPICLFGAALRSLEFPIDSLFLVDTSWGRKLQPLSALLIVVVIAIVWYYFAISCCL